MRRDERSDIDRCRGRDAVLASDDLTTGVPVAVILDN